MMIAVIVSALILSCVCADQNSPIVTVRDGILRGSILTTVTGRKFAAFQSVPYARPPLKEFRFRPPQPPEPWEGIRDATQDAPVCIQRSIFARQVNVSGTEDCLYLNVYTPKTETDENDLPLPVMVYFHGGGWVSGSGTRKFYGPEFLLDKDIVLVVPSYRLGPIGFLSTGDEIAPGNFGLKDQVAALRWVQENIRAFGGDPKSVTLFGESAGGASIHYHMLSQLSKGLFHRAISQSGTALCSWTLAPKGSSVHNAHNLGRFLDCPTHSSELLIDCLRTKDARDIIATDKHFMRWDTDPMIPFKPVIENNNPSDDKPFITADPLELIQTKSGSFDIPWIVGVNSEDGCLRSAPLFSKEELVRDLDDSFEYIAPISLFYENSSYDIADITQRIRRFYYNDKTIDRNSVTNVTNMFTDNWFLAGIDQAVKLHVQYSTAPLFYYYFTYRGTTSFSELFSGIKDDFGVCHADDLLYLFPSDRVFPDIAMSDTDEQMKDIFLSMWTNFAYTGHPTRDNPEVDIDWNPATSSSMRYLNIGSSLNMHEEDLLKERTDFWSHLPVQVRPSKKDEL